MAALKTKRRDATALTRPAAFASRAKRRSAAEMRLQYELLKPGTSKTRRGKKIDESLQRLKSQRTRWRAQQAEAAQAFGARVDRQSQFWRPNPNYNYPVQGKHHLKGTAKLFMSRYKRKNAEGTYGARQRVYNRAQSATRLTPQDRSMEVTPNQNMVKANIALSHRAADSSIAAGLAHMLNSAPPLLPATHQTVYQRLADEHIANTAGRTMFMSSVQSAAAATTQAAKDLHTTLAIDTLAGGENNVRYAPADENQIAGPAFHANVDEHGAMTPKSTGIKRSWDDALTASMLPGPLHKAITTPATNKTTGQPLVSTVMTAAAAAKFAKQRK